MALKWLFSTKDPKSKLVRWILQLQEFDMTILPRPGTDNGNADAMSRLPKLLESHAAKSHAVMVITRASTQSLPARRRDRGMDPDLVLDSRAYDIDEAK